MVTVPMVKAWPLTPTSVAETVDRRGTAQWQIDAAQPWSVQGFVSKFWISQEVDKPTLNQQYWAVFSRNSMPRDGKTGEMEWDYNWRIIDGGWGLEKTEAESRALQLNAQMPASPPIQTAEPANTPPVQGTSATGAISKYGREELIVRQSVGKMVSSIIAAGVLTVYDFDRWLTYYYSVIVGDEDTKETFEKGGEDASISDAVQDESS